MRLAVIQRLPWIKRQREQLQAAERQSEREMVTGESHYVWGIRHRLKVIERPGRAHVELDGDRLLLYVPAGTDADERREAARPLVPRAAARSAIPERHREVGAEDRTCRCRRWSIRRMKTKWGSCNRETGHIWFNVELAKKHPDCLEYIVVHEMTHLLERGHGERFTKLMDQFMPDWRAVETNSTARRSPMKSGAYNRIRLYPRNRCHTHPVPCHRDAVKALR